MRATAFVIAVPLGPPTQAAHTAPRAPRPAARPAFDDVAARHTRIGCQAVSR
jgi:hypothetical protein